MIATPENGLRRPHAANMRDGDIDQQTNLSIIVSRLDAAPLLDGWRASPGPVALLRRLEIECDRAASANDEPRARDAYALLDDVAAHLRYRWSAALGWEAVRDGR